MIFRNWAKTCKSDRPLKSDNLTVLFIMSSTVLLPARFGSRSYGFWSDTPIQALSSLLGLPRAARRLAPGASGLAMPLVAHALEQQRRFEGVEAAAKAKAQAHSSDRALQARRGHEVVR